MDRQLLESIHRHAQAADARRIAVEREFQRRARQAAINQTIDEIWQMNNPPPPVAVEYVEIDPDGSPHLGSPDFNPNHPAWTLKPRG